MFSFLDEIYPCLAKSDQFTSTPARSFSIVGSNTLALTGFFTNASTGNQMVLPCSSK
jgi:hypothetical protein